MRPVVICPPTAKGKVFNHGLDEFLENEGTIRRIDANVLRERFINNDDFAMFVHEYAWRISHDYVDLETALKDSTSQEAQNLVKCTSYSNISYALLICIVKEGGWKDLLAASDAEKRKAIDDVDGTTTKRVTRSGAAAAKNAKESDDDSAPSDDAAAPEVQDPSIGRTKPRGSGLKKGATFGRRGWIVGNRAKDRKEGFTEIAVLFYNTVKEALKEINKDEWKDTWERYYQKMGVAQEKPATNVWETINKSGNVFGDGTGEVAAAGDEAFEEEDEALEDGMIEA